MVNMYNILTFNNTTPIPPQKKQQINYLLCLPFVNIFWMKIKKIQTLRIEEFLLLEEWLKILFICSSLCLRPSTPTHTK